MADVSSILLDRVADWLTQSSLAGTDLESVVRGLCERMAAAGLPVKRVHLSFSMLHPLYDALGFTWERGGGMSVERFRTKPGERPERFLRSPYYHLISNNLDHLRRRIDKSVPSEFPVFDDLKELGITDYIAFIHNFEIDTSRGMIGSWSTDAPGGFSEDMIAALLKLQNHLAVAAKMAVLGRLAGNMLTTYLGGDAGQRVLSGQIKRGDGETIRAALVMADMRKSTVLAEKEGRQVYIDTLNQFFDAIAAPFNRSGGEILELPRRRLPRRLSMRTPQGAFAGRLPGRDDGGRQGDAAHEGAERRTQAKRPRADRLWHRPAYRQRHVRQCRAEGPADLLGVRRVGQRGAAAAGTDQVVPAQRRSPARPSSATPMAAGRRSARRSCVASRPP